MKPTIHSRKRALIVKFGQIGDVIMAIPAVRVLYEQGFDISWVCGRAAQPLLECYSWITLIPVDDKAILRGGLWERVKNIAGLWGRVAFKGYDLCATLYYDRRFHLLTLPIRARQKLAFSRQSRATSLLGGRHHTDEYLRVLLGTEDSCREQSSPPLRPDCMPSYLWPRKEAPRHIAIVPGGTSNVLGQQVLRRWPVERYVVLAQSLLDRGWEVVLLGGTDDAWVKPYFDQIAVSDCIGKLSLPEVISVCDACDGVVSHDTGPLHLAGLSRACLVGIFGPTDPANFLPRRPFAVGVWGGQGFACRPCYDGRDFAPCQFNGCMHQVTPERVLRELDQLISDRSLGKPSPWRIVYPDDNLSPDGKDLIVLR
jgi:lipopolysaccharide heptosyltransferase II